MKIKCKECKTIYDSSEKYCPYCFARTSQVIRYKTTIDGARLESPMMEKREKTPYNYRARKITKYKKRKNTDAQAVAVFIIVMVCTFVFISFLLSIFSFMAI